MSLTGVQIVEALLFGGWWADVIGKAANLTLLSVLRGLRFLFFVASAICEADLLNLCVHAVEVMGLEKCLFCLPPPHPFTKLNTSFFS